MATEAKGKSKKSRETIDYEEMWKSNPMKRPYLEKVVLNIGVGNAGEELERAMAVLEEISGKTPVRTISRRNIKEFNLRKKKPIGCKVTVRGKEAEALLRKLLIVNNDKVKMQSFDNFGNFSWGVDEHIKIPQTEFRTEIGIFGLNVCGRIVRPGMRVRNRRVKRSKVPRHHYVSKIEAQQWLKKHFGVDIVKEIVFDYV